MTCFWWHEGADDWVRRNHFVLLYARIRVSSIHLQLLFCPPGANLVRKWPLDMDACRTDSPRGPVERGTNFSWRHRNTSHKRHAQPADWQRDSRWRFSACNLGFGASVWHLVTRTQSHNEWSMQAQTQRLDKCEDERWVLMVVKSLWLLGWWFEFE